jgi:hypothetical protein
VDSPDLLPDGNAGVECDTVGSLECSAEASLLIADRKDERVDPGAPEAKFAAEYAWREETTD